MSRACLHFCGKDAGGNLRTAATAFFVLPFCLFITTISKTYSVNGVIYQFWGQTLGQSWGLSMTNGLEVGHKISDGFMSWSVSSTKSNPLCKNSEMVVKVNANKLQKLKGAEWTNPGCYWLCCCNCHHCHCNCNCHSHCHISKDLYDIKAFSLLSPA